jgi:hypothetical protein
MQIDLGCTCSRFHAGIDKYDGELVTTQAGGEIGGPNSVFEPRCDRAQELITGCMTVRVVDSLEAVEIDIQDSDQFCERLPARFPV